MGLHEEIKVVKVFEPKADTSTTDAWSGHGYTQGQASGIDLQDYDEAMVELSAGALVGGNLTVSLYGHTSDSCDDATAMTDDDSAAIAFDAKTTADQNKTYVLRIRAKDRPRYLFIKAAKSTADSKTYGINVLLGGAGSEPVTQENTVDHTDA